MVERNKCMSIPKIRFNGTKQNWEKAELSVYAKQYFVSNKNIHHHNLLSLSYGQIIRKDIKSKKGLLPSSYDTYQIVCKGIIVFRFTDLQNDRNSLRVGLVKEEGIITPAYICVQCKGVMPEFFYLQLYAYDLRKIFYKMGDGMRQTLSYKDIKNLFIYIPPTQEQEKIINHFDLLDKVIDLTSKKLASLKRIKAASLQSMFPQEGETVPEVRFKGFEGEWNFSILKDFSKKITEKNRNRLYKETFTNSAELGVVSQRTYFDHDISNNENINGYYVIHPDDFVYNPRISVTAPVGPINRNLLNKTGIMSPLYCIFSVNNINKTYLEYFFKTNLWHKYIYINGNAGARFDRLSITDENFFNMPILTPSTEEQQKIASYFCNLDKQISLQTQRLEKLKQIKSACLDKMFV